MKNVTWCLTLIFIIVGGSSSRRKQVLGPPVAVPIRMDGELELKLMSFNIRYESHDDLGARSWRARIVGVVKMLRNEQPDLFGVQEAQHGQVADLWASLPDYEFLGVGRDDGKLAGEYAGIFYRRDRFEADVSEFGYFWLSATPAVAGSKTWGNEFPRMVTWLRLVDRATGRGFYVFNTHWDHRNQPSREQSALLLAQRIDARKNQEEPIVLLGDFNATEANPSVRYLTGEHAFLAGSKRIWKNGLKDSFQVLHSAQRNRRTLHFWQGNEDGFLKVDHILVSANALVQESSIVSKDTPLVSDHFPVASRVIFPED